MKPPSRLIHALRGVAMLAAFGTLATTLPDCAKSRCDFNSDCEQARCVDGECVRECASNIDCPTERPKCSAGICFAGTIDAGGDGATTDTLVPADTLGVDTIGIDTAVPVDDAPIDTSKADTSKTDAPVGTGGYLDACTGDGDCASGSCTPIAPKFCTKSCVTHGECAHGQICGGGKCRLDDTGKTGCDPSTASPCLEYCYGSATTAHCTHDCSNASDCPAGFACSPIAGGKRVCVDIERPCATAGQCASGLGFCGAGSTGCTAECASAADCPNRIVGLPPYTCEARGTPAKNVCIPPSDVLGSDPLGTTCPATGTNTCRSGACDTGSTPAFCNTRCTPQGGCPSGFGCFPDGSGGSVDLICTPAGGGWLGDTCGRARDCITGLCDTAKYCTKLCNDGLCPTGWTCRVTGLTSTDGTPIKLCSK
jgi:hypothetical protein